MQLETAELRKGLDEIKNHMKEAGDAAESLLSFEVLKEVGKFAFEAAEKLADFVMEGAEAADKMGKLAASAQVPVETFERLSYAAKLGGVSAEELGGAFNKLNRALAEASTGGNAQAALFRAMGVSLKDSSGAARGSADIFKELATKLNDMAPGYAKARLEQDLFGKSGTQMDSVLKEVAKGMADAGGEADKFGLVLSDQAIQAATEFHDNMEKIHAALGGIAQRVAAQIAPALAELTDQLLHSAAGAEVLNAAVTAIVFTCRAVATAVLVAVEAFHLMQESAAFIGIALEALATGNFSLFAGIAKASVHVVGDELLELKERIKTVWSDSTKSFEDAGDAHHGNAEKILADMRRMEGESKAMEERFKEAQKLAEKLANEHFAEGDTAHKNSQTSEASVHAGQQFSNIGAAPTAIFAEATKGFKDFDDALQQYTTAQIGINNEQAAVNEAKKHFDTESYDLAISALESQEEIAHRSKEAADAFKNMAETSAKAMKSSLDKMSSGIASAAGHFLSKLGDLGTVVQSAISGFQQGGWWGAIIAVIVEVFSRFQRFAEIQQMATDQLEGLVTQLAPALGRLTNGFEKLMNSLGKMVTTVGTALGPVLDEVGRIFGVIGDVLGPIFSMIQDIIGPITDILHLFTGLASVLDPLTFVIKLVSYLFTLLGIAFTEIGAGLQLGIGKLLGWLADLADKIGLHDLAKTLGTMAAGMLVASGKAEQKAKDMWAQLGHDAEHFFDSSTDKNTSAGGGFSDALAGAKGNVTGLADASQHATKAIDKMAGALTNVPSGFRYAAAQYTASALESSGPGGSVHITINGSVISEKQLMDTIEKFQKQRRFTRSGI
jgi:phage-related protein